ncbi:MAG: hypothetical protein ACTSWR_10280 [Candidatus Helarchaeota archaeon]
MVEEALYQITKRIASEIGPMLTSRPYIGIIDKYGKIKYKDEAIDKYSDFISSFVNKNFNFLRVGDHSIPISGLNMVFFKISPKIVLVMFMKQGLVGQLLAFKKRMAKYASEIDPLIVLEPLEGQEQPEEAEVIEEVAPPPKEEIKKAEEEEEVKVIPQLIKKIRKKDKFPLKDIVVLNLCDGENTVKQIADKANVDVLTVWNILDEYKKKKYIKINYSGNPDFVPILTKKIPPMAVQLRLMSNLEYQIAKLCDGTRTIEEIEEKLEIDGDKLSELIDKMEKNKMIRMDIKRV